MQTSRTMPFNRRNKQNYCQVPNNDFDLRIPLHSDESFQHGIVFQAKVSSCLTCQECCFLFWFGVCVCPPRVSRFNSNEWYHRVQRFWVFPLFPHKSHRSKLIVTLRDVATDVISYWLRSITWSS